jgi:cyclophilin family peptidyl-prolyl cis-trans isomerase/HEAT repeat protein
MSGIVSRRLAPVRWWLAIPAIALPALLRAQDAAVVEAVAPMIAAEDARQWAADAFTAGVHSPDPLVRRVAAMSVGRVGDLRGTPLLIPLLQDPDTTVETAAAFALGLIRDSAAVATLISRLSTQPAPSVATGQEIISSLAKIGGRRAAELIAGVLDNTANLANADSRLTLVLQAAVESWRLGDAAPTRQLLALVQDANPELRWRVMFSLSQLRPPGASEALLNGLRDEHPLVRAYAAKGLTAGYAAASQLQPDVVIQVLLRATGDEQAGVRINALRSLGTYASPDVSDRIASLLVDPMPNVQVAAASTMGLSGGPVAAAQLARIVREGKGSFALQREALLGLSRASADSFKAVATAWGTSTRWPDRAAAAEGWSRVAPGAGAGHPDFLHDADGRVAAASLKGWLAAVPGPDPALLAAARGVLSSPDVGVRSLAADAIARAPEASDVAPLAAAFRRAQGDSVTDAALSALEALLAFAEKSDASAAAVNAEFLTATPRPADYTLRAWAEAAWPAASRRWGPAYPISTGRTLEDYRELARRFVVVPEAASAHPHVFIETDQRGVVEVELLGPDAPLTVVNFLTLLDRRYFDRGRWYRVVPNSVVQDGDPRGDGFGGPGYSIRDEINRVRYDGYILGMATSGPDTGASQWFLTLGPQPQYDGTYTVFGKVVGSPTTLLRITQGDQIRLIRR